MADGNFTPVTLGRIAVPDGHSGAWRVSSFAVSPDEARMTCVRSMVTGNRDAIVPAGDYKKLTRGGVIVMSNTPMEIRTNRAFVQRARGRILVNGLGLGMVLTAILQKPEVESVHVIENSADVIALVGPTFACDPRVCIVAADALTYQPVRGAWFDAVWHDIWDNITSDNLPEMHTLHRKYARRAGWQGSWCRAECEALRDGRGRYA